MDSGWGMDSASKNKMKMMVAACFPTDVSAALVHTVGLIAAHTVHAIQTSQQQRIIR